LPGNRINQIELRPEEFQVDGHSFEFRPPFPRRLEPIREFDATLVYPAGRGDAFDVRLCSIRWWAHESPLDRVRDETARQEGEIHYIDVPDIGWWRRLRARVLADV
jgi:hypothetical protein